MARREHMMMHPIPLEWQQNREAGLCPVCGKEPSEFEKNRKIYCSTKCSLAYSKKYVSWSDLRDRIVEKSPRCAKCRITREDWNSAEEKRRERIWNELSLKYREQIGAFRLDLMRKAEAEFLKEIDQIMKFDLDHFKVAKLVEGLEGKPLPDRIFFCGLEVDHIASISHGGDMWNENNLQVLCVKCHREKTKTERRNEEAT